MDRLCALLFIKILKSVYRQCTIDTDSQDLNEICGNIKPSPLSPRKPKNEQTKWKQPKHNAVGSATTKKMDYTASWYHW